MKRETDSISSIIKDEYVITSYSIHYTKLYDDRVAGAILITDGQTHDAETLATFPGPIHTVLTGEPGEFDRRLALESAPAFGLVGEEVVVTARVERNNFV